MSVLVLPPRLLQGGREGRGVCERGKVTVSGYLRALSDWLSRDPPKEGLMACGATG